MEHFSFTWSPTLKTHIPQPAEDKKRRPNGRRGLAPPPPQGGHENFIYTTEGVTPLRHQDMAALAARCLAPPIGGPAAKAARLLVGNLKRN